MKSSVKEFIAFLKEKKQESILIFIIYSTSLSSIGLINFPYLDDTARRVEGIPNFGVHYSRWMSEVAAWFVQGSRRLTDLGLTTFLLSSVILTLASVIVVYSLIRKKANIVSFSISLMIGLNPWYMNAVAFRFDNPYMSMSILFALIPFIFWRASKLLFFIVSFFGVFLMYNTYQASSGIYLLMVLTLLFIDVLGKQGNVKVFLQRGSIGLTSFGLATIAYYLQLRILPTVASYNSRMIQGNPLGQMIENLRVYFETLWSQSANIWIYLFVLVVIFFVIRQLLDSKFSFLSSFFCTISYFTLSFVASYGIYLFLEQPIAPNAPRYIYGFAVWIAIMGIVLSTKWSIKVMNISKNIVLLALGYYMVSFVFIFSSMLDTQKDTFIHFSTALGQDIAQVYQPGKRIVINRFGYDSPVLSSASINFPILPHIVPPNGAVWFPNRFWFSQITGLSSPVAMNPETIDFTKELKPTIDTFRWQIFEYKKDIFVVVR